MITRYIGLFGLALALITAGTALSRSHAVELVTGNNYFPYTDERLPGGGLGTIIVEAVFERMEVDTNITYQPWDQGMAATREGRFLATFPYIRTPEREQHFLYSEPIFTVRPYIFMNFKNAPGLTQPSDLSGRVLCVPQGWGVDGYLQPVVDSGQVQIFNQTNVVGCFRLLFDGKVDAISIDRRLGQAAANAISSTKWTKTRRLSNDASPNHLIVSKSLEGGQGWIDRFNAALDILRADGTVARLTREYFDRYK